MALVKCPILIVSILWHQDYLHVTLLVPPAVMLSMAYRSHKEVTVNLRHFTTQKEIIQLVDSMPFACNSYGHI